MKLSQARRFGVVLPAWLRPAAKGVLSRLLPSPFKYQEEIGFWDGLWRSSGFNNAHYRPTMLGLAGEPDPSFLTGKIVADFGCGPAGSLCWATPARARIGIDVLAEAYAKFDIRMHDMVYVASTEKHIPLPSNYIDVLYTLNAIDHVADFAAMCAELRRILAPGGLFLGSFNLDEPPTFSEPQTLTEPIVQSALLQHLNVESYRLAAPGPKGDTYRHFRDGSEPPTAGRRYLWVRARKLSP